MTDLGSIFFDDDEAPAAPAMAPPTELSSMDMLVAALGNPESMPDKASPLEPFPDPAILGFPPSLPLEIAMRERPVAEICHVYGITRDAYEKFLADPVFIRALAGAREMLQKDGFSFKAKAKMQAEALLRTSWDMIHNPHTPHQVRADLIKSTVAWAEYSPKHGGGTEATAQFNIQINL